MKKSIHFIVNCCILPSFYSSVPFMRQTQRLDNTCSISLSLTFSIAATYKCLIHVFFYYPYTKLYKYEMNHFALLFSLQKKNAYLHIFHENIEANAQKFNPHFLTNTQMIELEKRKAKCINPYPAGTILVLFLLNLFLLSNHKCLKNYNNNNKRKIKVIQ